MGKKRKEIYINGKPIPYAIKFKHQKDLAKTKEIIKEQVRNRIETGKIELNFKFYINGRPTDLDNLVKTYCDLLTGILYRDDVQVVRLTAEKVRCLSNPLTIIKARLTT